MAYGNAEPSMLALYGTNLYVQHKCFPLRFRKLIVEISIDDLLFTLFL